MDRLLSKAGGTVSITFYDDNGATVDPTGTVSVTVKDGAGATVTTGTGTKQGGGSGVVTFAITAAQATTMDTYDVDWTATVGGVTGTWTTQYEVVGGWPFSVADMRARDAMLANVTAYPTSKIVEARDAAMERFERAFRVSTVLRGRRVVLDGNGANALLVPDFPLASVYSCSVDGVAVTPTVRSKTGALLYPNDGAWARGVENVAVHYVHGLRPTPEPVRRALLLLALDYLVPSAVPMRATSMSTDAGDFRVTVAGKDGPTGIPEVDAVGIDFGNRRPAVG